MGNALKSGQFLKYIVKPLGNVQIKLKSPQPMMLLAGCDEKSLKLGKAELPSSHQQNYVNYHPFSLKHCISVITINVEEAVENLKTNISGSSPNRDPSKNITVTKSQARVPVPLKVTVQPNLEGIVSRLIGFPCFNKSSAVPTKTEAMLSRSNSRPKCRIAIQRCRRVADLWDGLYVRLLSLVPGFPSDRDLLWLAFPPCPLGTERLVVAHLGVLVAEIWETRSFLRPPSRAELAAAVRGHFPALRCLF
jgi:hypothetical protein